MWGIPLSGPLPIVATVGRCPAVQLIGRIPIPFRPEGLSPRPDAVARPHPELIPLSGGCAGERGRLDTRYSPVRRSPSQVASHLHAAPRLACVKPVASVHPEPGSNSTLYIIDFLFFLFLTRLRPSRRTGPPCCSSSVPVFQRTSLFVRGNP